MNSHRQRTLARPAETYGFGLFGGQDCQLRFLPAAEYSGLAFRRIDQPGAPPIPATVEFLRPAPRRTVISNGISTVEMIEHVLAALAGLWIDNCLIELNGPEPPVGDGSSQAFVDAILRAGIVEQAAPAEWATVTSPFRIAPRNRPGCIGVAPASACCVSYRLAYDHSTIAACEAQVEITPDTFAREIAFARTFVAADEIDALRRMGIGRRATTDNLLVFDAGGVRSNELRTPDECARHKILDAVGDLALCGRRVRGSFDADRSGHAQNHEVAAWLRAIAMIQSPATARRVA